VARDVQASPLIPRVSQDGLAERIGTTRSHASLFMNGFHGIGFNEFNDRVRVHRSLINVILHDRYTGRGVEMTPASASLSSFLVVHNYTM